MGWADAHIERLKMGLEAHFRPRGHSMEPRIRDRQLVVVQPLSSFYALNRGDVVLCTVKGHQYLHQILAIDAAARRVLIGNMRGRQNGWTTYEKVYGKLTGLLP